MDKIRQCGLIKYLQKKGFLPRTFTVATLGDEISALSTTIRSVEMKWAAEFWRKMDSCEDGPRFERRILSKKKKN